MRQISITTSGITIKASLNDTLTAGEILKILPIKSLVNVWGQEIYFTIPLKTTLEQNAVQDVEIGTIAYWPTGPALCIFFGPTPVSTGTKPRAYSPVNIIGQTIDNPSALKAVTDGEEIIVEAIRE
jgi:uncharacterized protein